MKELLELRRDPDQRSTGVRRQIDAKAREVNARIAHLRATRRALQCRKCSCAGDCPIGEYPIVESLDAGAF